jgi:hypothetical protein
MGDKYGSYVTEIYEPCLLSLALLERTYHSSPKHCDVCSQHSELPVQYKTWQDLQRMQNPAEAFEEEGKKVRFWLRPFVTREPIEMPTRQKRMGKEVSNLRTKLSPEH